MGESKEDPRKLREKFETPYFFLLESSGGEGGRSIAGWEPKRVIRSDTCPDILGELKRGMSDKGIWIGYLGYEFYTRLEKKVPPRRSDLIPEGVFCLYDEFYEYDHEKGGPLPPAPARRLCGGGEGRVVNDNKERVRGGVESNFSKPDYLSTISKIKNYITVGDCYQVNLSQRFSCETEKSPHEIYQALRQISPAPYSAYLNLGDAQILSASPECFLKVEGDRVTTRPIKGTRPRGHTPREDADLKEELFVSKKDRAELLMITDLLRNDLGRVCERGTVQVPRLLEVESYPQVHHLVSTIEGRLATGRDVIDLLKATFPGGSITGAPKIRAMQIIHELEPDPRNIYTGAIGYIGPGNQAQFNVAIRTMIVKGGRTYFWGGGGIVADSDPESEYQETLVKTEGLLKSV